jgi:hypothetical protein
MRKEIGRPGQELSRLRFSRNKLTPTAKKQLDLALKIKQEQYAEIMEPNQPCSQKATPYLLLLMIVIPLRCILKPLPLYLRQASKSDPSYFRVSNQQKYMLPPYRPGETRGANSAPSWWDASRSPSLQSVISRANR